MDNDIDLTALAVTQLLDAPVIDHQSKFVALADWLRRVLAKYMGFLCESLNLSNNEFFLIASLNCNNLPT